MNGTNVNSYGLILKRLRTMNGDTIRSATKKIGKSVGWLSEIESGRGRAKLTSAEFDRIVKVFGGEKYRERFKNWVIADRTVSLGDRSLDGAILKHFRKRKELTLIAASEKIGISKRYLTNLENGHKPITLSLRDRIMTAYGYAPSSFRNALDDNKRGKSVPARYKINALLNQMADADLDAVLEFILSKVDRNSGPKPSMAIPLTAQKEMNQ